MQNESGRQQDNDQDRRTTNWDPILVGTLSGGISDAAFQAFMDQINRDTMARVNLTMDLPTLPSESLESILASSDELGQEFADRDNDPAETPAGRGTADSVEGTNPLFDFLFELSSAPASTDQFDQPDTANPGMSNSVPVSADFASAPNFIFGYCIDYFGQIYVLSNNEIGAMFLGYCFFDLNRCWPLFAVNAHTPAAAINGNVRNFGMLVWTDGPDMGERIHLFCAHGVWPAILPHLTQRARLPLSDQIYEFSHTDLIIGHFLSGIVNSNLTAFDAGSKRPRSASPHASPRPSFLDLPVTALGPLSTDPSQSFASKPASKRIRPSKKRYTETFLKNVAPKCNILCISARRDVRHTMLTDQPYPSPTQGYVIAEAAYNKIQRDRPDIRPETSYQDDGKTIPLNQSSVIKYIKRQFADLKGQGKTATDSLLLATYGDLTPARAGALLEHSAYSYAENHIGDLAFTHPMLHRLALRLVRDNHETLDPKHHPMTEVTLAIAATFKFIALYNIAHQMDYERRFKHDGGWGHKFRAILQEVKDNQNSPQFREMLETWGGEISKIGDEGEDTEDM